MADSNGDAKVTYPYLSSNQWYAVRNRMRQSPPRTIDIDWLIGKLDITQKTAQNLLPQLRALGVVDSENRVTSLGDDLRHDETYAEACTRILEAIYPESLRNAHSDPDEDPTRVASWFSRNARTGEVMSKNQSRTYLLLLGGKLPSADEPAQVPRQRRRAESSTQGSGQSRSGAVPASKPDVGASNSQTVDAHASANGGGGPNLHIDVQVHISADAGDAQIDSIFKSMAKHLYGR